jgi:hypothetical protein
MGLKTTLITQLCPAPIVVPSQVLDAMVKLAREHTPPPPTPAHVSVALLNGTGLISELVTSMS